MWSDPQFLVQEQGEHRRGTLSPTITWKDEAAGDHDHGAVARQLVHHHEPTGTTTSRRWRSTTPTGTASTGRPTCWGTRPTATRSSASTSSGDTDLDFDDCLDDGTCSESASLQYLSPDGKKLSATVQPWLPATGAPSFDADAR